MPQELHIASLVVHTTPRRLDSVAQALQLLPTAEVHATAPSGKLVLTMEAPSGEAMSQLVAHVQHIDGVLSAALVYQCADDIATMNEEMTDA